MVSHSDWPFGQQLPFWHAIPAGHTVPQAPQLFGSLCSRAQLQLTSPPLVQPHAPFWQVWAPVHVLPQPPQLALVVGSTQTVGKSAGQPMKLTLQLTSQLPDEQAGVPFGSPGHTFPHEPQLFGSVAPTRHWAPSPAQHSGMPPPHTKGALGPHPPQLVGSPALVSVQPGWPVEGIVAQ